MGILIVWLFSLNITWNYATKNVYFHTNRCHSPSSLLFISHNPLTQANSLSPLFLVHSVFTSFFLWAIQWSPLFMLWSWNKTSLHQAGTGRVTHVPVVPQYSGSHQTETRKRFEKRYSFPKCLYVMVLLYNWSYYLSPCTAREHIANKTQVFFVGFFVFRKEKFANAEIKQCSFLEQRHEQWTVLVSTGHRLVSQQDGGCLLALIHKHIVLEPWHVWLPLKPSPIIVFLNYIRKYSCCNIITFLLTCSRFSAPFKEKPNSSQLYHICMFFILSVIFLCLVWQMEKKACWHED